jgi:hypothetical protein
MVRRSAKAPVREEGKAQAALPAGAPSWVTPELLELTIKTWQPYYAETLTAQDALAMVMGVSCLFELLKRPG